MIKKIAIIGAGVSGLSVAQMLKDKGHTVHLFEKKNIPGGLIGCSVEQGNLFHRVGGHVFNTRIPEVENWFWSRFDKKNEFLQAKRNAKIYLNDKYIGYPIENHIYELQPSIIKDIVKDLLALKKLDNKEITNFYDFLRYTFGETLFHLYFEPYNRKIWNYDLKKVPLEWLEGKLPMPKIDDIFLSNIIKKEESAMVHSSFYYPIKNGSAFIAERLAEGLDIHYNSKIENITFINEKWNLMDMSFDSVIYTADVRELKKLLISEVEISTKINELRSNGTSNVLCYTDKTDLSWLYLPSNKLKCHRIIYTGNFSENNNATNRNTCTVEFSGHVSKDDIINQLKTLPGNLKPISFNYEPNSYVIQNSDSRLLIDKVKQDLTPKGFHLLGRFAEWEYYNMDKAIEAGLNLIKNHFHENKNI
ncbi:FAD-dependent oxidoreductase [Winogradskyella sp. PAMC22761]|nr:FAD-dependent oxidoreductase [Winogradskyella sp. PAMC22761]